MRSFDELTELVKSLIDGRRGADEKEKQPDTVSKKRIVITDEKYREFRVKNKR